MDKLQHYITGLKRRNTSVREFLCAGGSECLLKNLPFQIDKGAGKNIILKEDTAVELGPPDRASFQTILVVESWQDLRDGLITLIGPDITTVSGRSLPFGQVILAGGEQVTTAQIKELERKQYISDRLPGYMVRAASRRIWSRVSKEALERGFCFETLGRNLMAHYKRTFPCLEAIEILFITSSDGDVADLRHLLTESHLPLTPAQSRKEVYGCTSELDCEDCPNKPICDRISEMALQFKERKGLSHLDMKGFAREILALEAGHGKE